MITPSPGMRIWVAAGVSDTLLYAREWEDTMARQRLLTDEHRAGLPMLPLDERDPSTNKQVDTTRKGQTSEIQLGQRGLPPSLELLLRSKTNHPYSTLTRDYDQTMPFRI